jgi:sugar transferase (PEP-CTERM system associated)
MLRIFRHYVSAPALMLLALESAILVGIIYSFQFVTATAEGHSLANAAEKLGMASFFAAFAAAVMWAIGVYDKQHLADFKRIANRLLVSLLICAPVALIALRLHPILREEFTLSPSRETTLWIASIAIGFASVFVTRAMWDRVADKSTLQRRILVLGVGPRAEKIERFAMEHPDVGFSVLGYLRAPGGEAPRVNGRTVIPETPSILATARQLGAAEVVVALSDRRGMPVKPLLECRLEGVVITDYLTFWERESGQLMLDALDPSWLIYSDGFRLGSAVNSAVKRLVDLVVSLGFAMLLLPVMLAAAIAIKLDSRGPVFYSQERVGRNGRPFMIYKFRSMRADAEAQGAPQWAAKRDPRITRIGAFLRKTRIDELPQILNVLKGDMSFIGPRPERPFFVDNLAQDIPYYSERHRVRPGITGWAQVNYPYGASIEDAREKLSFDFYYIKNYSLLLDLLVLLATVQVVFWPKGVR